MPPVPRRASVGHRLCALTKQADRRTQCSHLPKSRAGPLVGSPGGAGRAGTAMRWLARWHLRLSRPLAPPDDLTRCEVCGAHVVNPVDWHEHDESLWWVLMRCGECAWSREVLITDAQTKALERGLERGRREIAELAVKLDRERMQQDVDTFVT